MWEARRTEHDLKYTVLCPSDAQEFSSPGLETISEEDCVEDVPH